MRILTIPVLMLAVTLAGPATAGDTPSVPGTSVYFVNLEDGQTVQSPVKVIFGLSGMGVAPAGVDKPKTGHHHLLIDMGFGDVDTDAPLPASDTLRHFGGGQTEAVIDLSPGRHTLQLVLGDMNHIPHDPPVVSQRITVVAK